MRVCVCAFATGRKKGLYLHRSSILDLSLPPPLWATRQDYAYNATFPEFRSRAEGCGKQVLEVIQIFLNHVRQEGELGLPDVGDAGDPEVFQVCWR